jgi:quercetin 2,3-dioxygenase
MIERRPFHELPGEDLGWLKARRHFSLAAPDARALRSCGSAPRSCGSALRSCGSLRIWNDDEIAPHAGFPPHAHANMEIITYVREGAVTHKDSLGNKGKTNAGDVQVMSAGTGIRHAEYNTEDVPALIFQIWIAPDANGGPPTFGSQPFPKADRSGRLVAFASGFESDIDALPIRARARVLGAKLKVGQSVEYAFGERRHAYLVPSSGTVDVNGLRIHARDGAAITDVAMVRIAAIEDSDVVMVDVP